jgi:hypothetical protein
MSSDGETRLEEVGRMVQDRFPEGLVRVLERKFPNATYADCEDAVSTGFEKLVATNRRMENPRGYVTTVAMNAMMRTLRRAALQQLAAADDDGGPQDLLDGQTDAWSDPVADETVTDDAYAFMRRLVDAWESTNLRTATGLVLAAARLGEPLSGAELAERLEELLHQEVRAATARQWRKRGLDRLRRELIDADLIEDTEEH